MEQQMQSLRTPARSRSFSLKGNLNLGTRKGKMIVFSFEADETGHQKLVGEGFESVQCTEISRVPLGQEKEVCEWLCKQTQDHSASVQKHDSIMHPYPHESMELFLKPLNNII